jgi:lysophospholipase L1-like esterase
VASHHTTLSPHTSDLPGRPPYPARILALGDSYTVGEGVASRESWPSQLAARIRSLAHDVADPVIMARTGWTTDELMSAIEARDDLPSMRFDFVTLLIGVNDQYRGRPIETFIEGFRALVDRAILSAAGNREAVALLSIPDWSVTPFASGRDRSTIAREIERFNQAVSDEAASSGVTFLNISDIASRAGDEPPLLSPDGLHPSGAMYSEWVDRIAPTALAVISRRSPHT